MKPDSPELFDKKLSMISDLLSPLLIDKGKLNDVATLLILSSLCSSDSKLKSIAALSVLPVLSQIFEIIAFDDSILSVSGSLVTGVC